MAQPPFNPFSQSAHGEPSGSHSRPHQPYSGQLAAYSFPNEMTMVSCLTAVSPRFELSNITQGQNQPRVYDQSQGMGFLYPTRFGEHENRHYYNYQQGASSSSTQYAPGSSSSTTSRLPAPPSPPFDSRPPLRSLSDIENDADDEDFPVSIVRPPRSNTMPGPQPSTSAAGPTPAKKPRKTPAARKTSKKAEDKQLAASTAAKKVTKKPRGRAVGSQNFGIEESTKLVELILLYTPIGGHGWDAVRTDYMAWAKEAPRNYCDRDTRSLRHRFERVCIFILCMGWATC